MLWAFPVARKSNIALTAIPGKSGLLGLTKIMLLLRLDHCSKRSLHDVAEPVLRIDEMIAGIQIAAMLHCQCRPARATKYTQARLHPRPHLQADIEELYKIPAHILPHPFVEDRTEKLSELE